MRKSTSPFSPTRRDMIWLLFSAVVILLLLIGDPVLAQVTSPRVSGLSGAATMIRDGDAQSVVVGMELDDDDRIVTGIESKVEISLGDGDSMVLGGASAAIIRFFSTPSDGGREGLIELLRGILRVALRPGPDTDVEVSTRTAIASVRSTEWIVEAKPDSTGVFTVSGHVEVRSRDTGAEVTLSAGEGSDVAIGQDPTAPKLWGEKRVRSVIARTQTP